MSFWKRFDAVLTKWEKKGFNFANKAHVYTVNILLITIAWQSMNFFKDYNQYFLDTRVFLF